MTRSLLLITAACACYGALLHQPTDGVCAEVAQPGQRIRLASGWLLQSSLLADQDGRVISTEKFKPADWYETSVPSTVLNALIRNGVYPDMRIGLNSFLIPDSSDEFNRKHDLAKHSHLPGKQSPWRQPLWYRTKFELPTVPEQTHVWLHFDAINYRADVWLNGRQVADRHDMVGMFRRFAYDVTPLIRAGKNYLAVQVHPVDHPGEPDTQLEVFGRPRGYFKDIMRDVTEIMTVGYDCMPTVPDRNMGIWQDVYIDFTGPVDIRHPFVVTDLPLPRTDEATLKISAEVFNGTATTQKGVLRGEIIGTDLSFEKEVELKPDQTTEVTFAPYPVLKNPRLWWPVNYGPQNLHHLQLTFEADGMVSDATTVAFGVREISKHLHELDGAHGLQLHINGRKIFCRGGYIQHELLFDWDRERIETEVKYFTSANLNLVYFEDIPNPPDAFLEACDRHGLLVGTCFYSCYWLRPGTGYPDDLDLLEKCTVDIIKRYRNHPCIWLYMAMNEEDTREVVYKMWRGHVAELDGTRIWIPSAYFPDGRENVPEWFKPDLPTGMTDIGATYTWKEPKWYYQTVRYDRKWMFMMESGSASLPPIESLSRFIPDLGQASRPEVYPLNKTWAHHGANSYYRDYDRAIRRIYGQPETVADYCLKGHLVTADQHRAMFEAVNHRMWNITSGFTQWKINACWPSVQWQIFDWYLKPMVSYYYIKKACEPLHVQLGLLEPTVTVVNNRLQPQKNLQVAASVYDFNMKLLYEKEALTDIEANTYKDVFTIPQLPNRTPVYFVKLQLADHRGKILSDNFYWLSDAALQKPAAADSSNLAELNKLPLVELDVSHEITKQGDDMVACVNVRNPTDKLAFFIHLAVTDNVDGKEILPVSWDDNYFSLLPHEAKQLRASFAARQLQGATAALEVGGWNIRSKYECKNLSVSAARVAAGESFTVTADISNTFIDGSPVELLMDGKPLVRKTVWAQRDAQQVCFTVRLDEPGKHTFELAKARASVLVE